MTDRHCTLAREAIVRLEAHEKHCAKRERDVDQAIVRIFEILDGSRNRVLQIAGAIILIQFGLIGFLCQRLLFP